MSPAPTSTGSPGAGCVVAGAGVGWAGVPGAAAGEEAGVTWGAPAAGVGETAAGPAGVSVRPPDGERETAGLASSFPQAARRSAPPRASKRSLVTVH